MIQDFVIDVNGWIPYLTSGALVAVVEVIRLEGKIFTNERVMKIDKESMTERVDKVSEEHAQLEERFILSQDRIADKLSIIEKHLARIDGRLSKPEKIMRCGEYDDAD